MDFAHLKGEFNGTMGTITFKDSNNKLIQVATCVTRKESGDSYRYLIDNALRFPPLARILNSRTTTVFTDKHKGSDAAVPDFLPKTEHLRCVEHLLKNGGSVGTDGRHHVYQAARAPAKETFDYHMDIVKNLIPKSYDHLYGTPHETWAMYATRGNVVLDQVTSNMSEATNSMIGAETRAKPVLDLLQDIVMQSMARLHDASNVKALDDNAIYTPFAIETINGEYIWAKRCTVSPFPGGTYMVYPDSSRRHYNVVSLTFNSGPGDHVYDCSCGWCERWLTPCRHVMAVVLAKDENHRALELVNEKYLLAPYRAAARDTSFPVVPPVWSSLRRDPTHLPPLRVDDQAGRKKGVRAHKRKASNGEFNTSSRNYALHMATSSSQAASLSQGAAGSVDS